MASGAHSDGHPARSSPEVPLADLHQDAMTPVVGRDDGATVLRPALAVLVRLRCLEDVVPGGRVGVAGILDV